MYLKEYYHRASTWEQEAAAKVPPLRKTKRHAYKSARSENKNVGEVKEITLRELKDLADKAREGNLHKKVRMPAYNILIQHIHNAKEYDSRYKNILEEKTLVSFIRGYFIFRIKKLHWRYPSRDGKIRKISKLTSRGGRV